MLLEERGDGHAARLDEAVEAVIEAEHLDTAVARRFHHGADDLVQPRRIAAAGEHADAFDVWHEEVG